MSNEAMRLEELQCAQWTADVAMGVLRQIAAHKRNTREKLLAQSAVTFIETQLAARVKQEETA